MIDTTTGAPEDYDDLFVHYFGFVKSLVARNGINQEDVEDVAMDILTKFIEKDALSWYDPNLLHDVSKMGTARLDGPRHRPARFSGLLRSFVSRYVLQYRDKQNTRNVKEPIHCDAPVGQDDAGNATSWIEVYGGNVMPDLSPEFWEWVERASTYLSALTVRGTRDLHKVFQMTVEQVTLDGAVNRKAIAAEFGVSDTAVCHMFKDLRRELESFGWKADALLAS